MHGPREPSHGRTQGALVLGSTGATEDDAWRRVLAFQAPPSVAGRATYLWWGVSRSSGVANTPSVTLAGSGSGDSSARWIASFRTFLTPAPISSSSASERAAFSRSQLRNRSSGSRLAHSSNISFGT